ncbi:alcohol dehydrogenase catalytic domain-containing protein [bacterium]|nr:alcohol dehydrogenase catalytic domain-containing protein [bacterium]
MKAAILKSSKIEIAELEKPTLVENKGAIVKISGCGLCGSDIVKLKHNSVPDGTVLGHEIVGTIVEIDSESDFEVGDKIVMGHHVPCFNCTFCFGENYSMCRNFKRTNIVPGGFAEYIFVSEEHLLNTVFRISTMISDEEISFTEPLACCIRCIKRTNMEYNSNILIVGLGSIGILMGQAARGLGYKPFGVDLIDDRVQLAKDYGFEDTFVLKDLEETVQEMKLTVNPAGFDAIIMTSGSDKAIDLAFKSVRDGGTINVFSSVKSDVSAYPNNEIYYRELTVTSSYSSSPVDLEEAFELLQNHRIKTDGLSTMYPMEKLNEAISDTLSNKIMKAYITL